MNFSPTLLQSIETWTKEDVQKWFEYCIEEYSLSDINLNDFQMNGKALLLLSEEGFKQRAMRSGDVLHKALQKHHALIKSVTPQNFQYQFWNTFPHPSLFLRPYNIPFPSAFNANIPVKQEENEIISKPLLVKNENDNTKQIKYYSDRVDYNGEILMKPQAGKNCRILWEFLHILLENPDYESIIHWENREKMIFRIVHAEKLAALWGLQKNRLSMTYEKLSRGMRYYYANNIISKEQSKRLLYRFMRSPEEIRRNVKRQQNMKLSNTYQDYYSTHTPRSDRSSSSSPESIDSEKKYSHSTSSSSSSSSSTKRKQTIPISLTNRLSQIDQPLNLAVPKSGQILNYKKQKFIYSFEQ